MTGDQIRRAVDLGAWVELCYLPCLWGAGTAMDFFARQSAEEFAGYVSVAPERNFITTDLGQRDMPNPLDGMRDCIRTLLESGVSADRVDVMVRRNPAWLVGMG